MSATLLGTHGTWGIAADETGMLVESVDTEAKNSEKAVKNKSGETQGLSLYDHLWDVSVKGQMSGFTGTLGSVMAVANVGLGATGLNVIKSGMKLSLAAEDFVKIDVPSTFYPLMGGG